MSHIEVRDCAAKGLDPKLFPPVEGHQDKFEGDLDCEYRVSKILPSTWIKNGYWNYCEAHRKRLFGYTTREYIRMCLWGGKPGQRTIGPAHIKALGLKMKDYPPF